MPDVDTHSAIEDLDLLTEAGRTAVDIALGYFRRDPKVWRKNDASPVSEADLAVDRHLRETLTAARPGYGWLSEETEDGSERLECDRLFVVDPIDGTRGFLAGTDQWTISLAVVEGGRPVAAVLYQPTLGRLYHATLGGGAFLDGKALTVPARSALPGARVAGPSAMVGRFSALEPSIVASGYVASLALRIAMVADGSLDVALSKPNAHDWDVAAADLILAEAGGALFEPSAIPLAYNLPAATHGALVGAAAEFSSRLAGRLRDETK